ncbi:MAG: histidinol dehydrogenase [Eubacterium sp.]|nr:histidinol dehydrogenase [Eubacterium sp.]
MMKIIKTSEEIQEYLAGLKKRGSGSNEQIEQTVRDILADVAERGDAAVKEYTAKFDCENPVCYRVSEEMISDALTEADPRFVDAMLNSVENITKFHQKQKQNGYMVTDERGCILGQRVRGLDRVGLYVPGGTAALFSSVLMNAIPAKIAGVGEIVMVTPPQKDGTANKDILVAASLCGVDKIFLCGGAQAVAALAYGTDEIPKVSKIVGPGNIFVATAKKQLYGTVDIDMIAGPSEVLVLADGEANPVYAAADLMSQAEHDRLAGCVLVTTSEQLANEVIKEIERQSAYLSRKEIIDEALDKHGAIIICRDMDSACHIANEISPEHLEVLVKNPLEYIGRLENCGSLFLGEYAPEPLGDYYAGPNHVLPTSGTARFFSPLSVDSFIKKSSYIYYTRDALYSAKDDVMLMADREQLTAHANAVGVRFGEGKDSLKNL